MRYRTKQEGDVRIKIRFAWFPHRLNNGQTVWLERFKTIEMWIYQSTASRIYPPYSCLIHPYSWNFINLYLNDTTNEQIMVDVNRSFGHMISNTNIVIT